MLVHVNRPRASTLVLLTHDPELASRTDEVIMLRDGRLVEPMTAEASR